MKNKLMIWLFSFTIYLTACRNANDKILNQKQVKNSFKADTPLENTVKNEINSGYGTYDSLAIVQNDTTTLAEKRHKIMNNFYIENRPSSPDYDTLFDLNYDGHEDYGIGYYGPSGTGIKNRVKVYFFNPKLNSYFLNAQLSDLANPSFYIKQKIITSFYIGNGGGGGVQLEWLEKKWTLTKEFEVDNGGDTTKWKINYPLNNKTKVIVKPFQMIPPQDILESESWE